MVCPVFDPDVTKMKVYIPFGAEWTEMFSNEAVVGCGWQDVDVDIMYTPVYVKKGAQVPMFEIPDKARSSADLKVINEVRF